jgi:hypothetical protein
LGYWQIQRQQRSRDTFSRFRRQTEKIAEALAIAGLCIRCQNYGPFNSARLSFGAHLAQQQRLYRGPLLQEKATGKVTF